MGHQIDDIEYRQITLADLDQLGAFYYEQFLPHEPLSTSMDLSPLDHGPWVRHTLNTIKEYQKLSFIALHCGSIIGMSICKDNPRKDTFADTKENQKTNLYLGTLDSAYDGVDLSNFGSDVAMLEDLGVAEEYRKRGIATHLVELTISACRHKTEAFIHRAHKITSIIADTTNLYSCALFDHMGFERLRQVRFDQLVMDGQKVIKSVDSTHQMLTVHGMKLSKLKDTASH